MIVVFAAMMLAQESGGTAVRNNLSTCLIYSSRMPQFASQTGEELSQDASFFKAALHYCSDDVLPYWDLAHERAKSKLGIQPQSEQPLRPQDAAKMLGEEDAAEKEMLSIVGEVWQEARKTRSTVPPIPDATAAKFALAWLSDLENRSSVGRIIDKPIRCIDVAAKAGTIDAGGFMIGQLDARKLSNFKEVAQGCGYINAVDELSKLAQEHLVPGISHKIAAGAANAYVSELVFWSFTEGP